MLLCNESGVLDSLKDGNIVGRLKAIIENRDSFHLKPVNCTLPMVQQEDYQTLL